MHQDTAFVRVSRPMEMAASWLAMEDIEEGSGELTYYVGSHRVREHLFNGKDKWMPHNDYEAYLAFIKYLDEECRARGFKKETFRPKKGDVLIWSADLVHGGSAIARPELTRRSFVAHWCPVSAEHYYFAYGKNCGRIKMNDTLSYSYNYYGPAMAPENLPPELYQKRGLWDRLRTGLGL